MELSKIFELNPLLLHLTECRKQSARLSIHITGDNLKSAIETMDEFETEQKKNLRQKYSRSNKDIFCRIHRPIDKVFSASGGSLVVNIPESQQKAFNVFLSRIRKGMSLRKWVQQIALPAYHIDPNGVILMEIDDNGNPYPTYKSTNDIFYYELDGREVKMLVLQLSIEEAKKYALQTPYASNIVVSLNKNPKETKYFRVIDDVTDKIVQWDGKELTEIPELNLPNPFPVCPAIIISDIYQFNSEILLSPDSEIVELANDILTDNSTFTIWKKLHMYPKHWRIKADCSTCMGTGEVSGEKCRDCNGDGKSRRNSVRDEIIVPIPDGTDGKISFPDKYSGYDTPGIEPWELMTGELERLYNFMFETKWGYPPKERPNVQNTGDKSATQVLEESNGKVQRLYGYSEWAESIEKFIIDMCGTLLYGSAYKGCSVNYGDRYIMEGPDEIWFKYSDARKNGAAQAVLDDLLRDYYESRYFGNPLQLQAALKQMRVEPWVHLTIDQVSKIMATELDKSCKTYFSEWASTLKIMDWVQKTDDVLRAELVAYCTDKAATVQAEFQAQAELARPKVAA